MAWTYSNNYHKPVTTTNTERLIELWESFGATGLFILEVEYQHSLVHNYCLKKTDICISAFYDYNDKYQMIIRDGDEIISVAEFWERIPKKHKKTLAYHLDQLVV